ncbi:unnamed protein product [Acanthoscelides obtectus]|uniref:MADF domain-containing protein n=1 Tax=Acanthoscelides obtectus TaxID=200917 RepID=A0A9P0LNN7_ACAOB|nr:unnamed protein product [Acanthoscelides obtectus]CAK1657282.1 hypothetical protein AOBTE_LOCUS20268 [Acanthoscelides obtectus]
MSFNWDDEAVLLLIEKFHENDILWNPRNADYKNRNKRMDALNIIASVFDIDKGEVERKLKNLTSHYFREKKKFEQLQKSGAGIDDVQEPKWFAYKALNFLRDKNKPLPTVNSENDMDSQKSQQDNATATSSRKRRCGPDGDSDIAEALQVLKNMSASSSARDDASVFGEYIASKIRKMDPMTTSTVQYHIQNIIYQAEMGVYSRPSKVEAVQGYFTTSTPESVCPSNYTDNSDTKDSLFLDLENN